LTYDGDGLLMCGGAVSSHRSALNALADSSNMPGFVASSSMDFDNVGAMRNLHYSWSGGTFLQSYGRDSLGRITTLVDAVSSDTSRTYNYIYTNAGRLREVDRGATILARYDYDVNGNRIAATGPGGAADSATATYDGQDRLLRYGATRYTYNRAGDVTSRRVGTDTTRYTYDELGNLTRVQLPAGDVIDYVIDGQNRRVGRTVNGHNLQGWLYDNALRPIAELDSVGAIVTRYIYGTRSNAPDYMLKGGLTYRIISDDIGTIRLIVRADSGQVAERLDYDSWGKTITNTNPGFISLGFAGGLTDADTRLIRFGARDYDPEVGRWTTKDPIGIAGSTNVYAYVNNDPLSYVDPMGYWTVGGGVSGVVGISLGPYPGGFFSASVGGFYNSNGTAGVALQFAPMAGQGAVVEGGPYVSGDIKGSPSPSGNSGVKRHMTGHVEAGGGADGALSVALEITELGPPGISLPIPKGRVGGGPGLGGYAAAGGAINEEWWWRVPKPVQDFINCIAKALSGKK
jgi:RHS repeat-associated protein